LFNITGASIGRVTTAPADMAGARVNQHVCILRPTDKLMPEFLSYYMRSPDQQVLVGNNQIGGTRQAVTKEMLLNWEIHLPPLAEQGRIVTLLNEADELRKLRAQADRRTADLISALFHEMFGDPGTNSKGWPVKPFGDLANNQDGRRKPVKASDRAERKGEYPYYGASGIIDYVEEYLFDETALLIGEDGANLLARSTPIAFLAHGKYWVNNHAHVVTDNGKADLNYLCMALNLRDLTDYVTGSAQPKLNQANMNRIPIPVPPLPLQKEFAACVSDIRAMQAEQAASRRRLDDLFQSMLHRAFQGDL
jgi:type I restriction enzyme S subunit